MVPRSKAVGWIASCLPLLAGTCAWAETAAPVSMAVVCTTSFLRLVNRADAVAAGKVYSDVMAKQRGYVLSTRFDITDTLEQLRARIKKDQADLVILDSIEYLSLSDVKHLTPVTTTYGGKNGARNRLLLIGIREAGITRLEGLRGKSINYLSRSDANLSRIWIEVLLHQKNLGRAARFFRSEDVVPKPSSACLPVFFGKSDACVLDGESWALLQELNPQLGKKLVVISTSPELIETLTCFLPVHMEYKELLIQSLLDLDKDQRGKQLLLMFKTPRVVLLEQRQLDAIENLWAEYLSFAKPEERVTPANAKTNLQNWSVR